jgi:hypothetical protein
METELLPTEAVTYQPRDPAFRLPPAANLSRSTQAEIAKFYNDVREHEQDVANWRTDCADAADKLLDTAPRESRATGDKLRASHAYLELERREFLWELFAVRRKVLPDYRRAAADANVEYERLVAEEMTNFESMGAGIEAMPAGFSNERAARHQLRHRVEGQEWILAAAGDRNRAREAVRVLESQLEILPTPELCKIAWPSLPPDVPRAVADWAGLCGPAALANAADRLGLYYDDLDRNERERLAKVEAEHPGWGRARKVQFVRVGA